MADVTIHAALDGAGLVIPTELNTNVLLSIHVDLKFVFQLHDVDEVIKVGSVGVLDSEIVYNQGERDVPSDVCEEAVGVACADIVMFFEVGYKVIVRNFAGLFESIPRFIHPCVHISVVYEGVKVVVFPNPGRNEVDVESYVLSLEEERF